MSLAPVDKLEVNIKAAANKLLRIAKDGKRNSEFE